MARRHIVLVPGFVGFDALGQIRYYVGVSTLFRSFASRVRVDAATVHYFDNFPTASVANRAQRLRAFLAKRFARGEMRVGDEITLIGHSTGGLDIRKLLIDLSREKTTTSDDRIEVENDDVRRAIRKIVFLSVPHYGTNIADYASTFESTVQTALGEFAAALRNDRSPVKDLRKILNRKVEWKAHALTALEDALNESDEVADREIERANEREARSQLVLWLEHMTRDFSAIDDLRAGPRLRNASSPSPTATDESPAHFSAKSRAEELACWGGQIRTRSYATVVPVSNHHVSWISKFAGLLKRPLAAPGSLIEQLERSLPKPLANAVDAVEGGFVSILERGSVLPLVKLLDLDPALLFWFVYALCAAPTEPFETPLDDTTHPNPIAFPLQPGPSLQPLRITNLDNDGIVNTQSMFWPYEAARPELHRLFVVVADHGDIVGQYGLRPHSDVQLKDRRHDGYDIFQSDSGFQEYQFNAVWTDIAKFVFDES